MENSLEVLQKDDESNPNTKHISDGLDCYQCPAITVPTDCQNVMTCPDHHVSSASTFLHILATLNQ